MNNVVSADRLPICKSFMFEFTGAYARFPRF